MVRKRLEAVGKVVEEGAKKLGATVSPGVKRGGTKKGGGSKYYERNKKGQVASVSEKKLARRGAATAGAGTVAVGAGASSLFKDGKKQSKPVKRERSAQEKETKSQAAARIKKNMQDYEKQRPSKKTWKDVKSVAAAKRAGLKHYTGADGKKKLAITKEELGQKKGETLTQAYNRVQGKTPRKQSASSAKTSGTKSTTQKKKVGGIRKFLLGEDGKFGGARGAIDFLPGKSRPKRKAGGGMMKRKGMAKGGAMKKKGYAMGGAAMKKKGYKKGGAAGKFPDLTGDGKVTQKDILKGRGVPGFSKGGMVVEVLKDLMTMGARAAEKKHGKGAVSQAKKELNRISGVKTTQAAKTPKQKKLAAADFRAERRGKTAAGKKQTQIERNEMRMAKGGSVKKKGMAKGGAMTKKGMAKGGAMKKKGYAKGGMTKKGYAKGGMTKKGYAKGGAAMRSKMSAKGGKKGGVRRGKPRGVGVALRGFGKALR